MLEGVSEPVGSETKQSLLTSVLQISVVKLNHGMPASSFFTAAVTPARLYTRCTRGSLMSHSRMGSPLSSSDNWRFVALQASFALSACLVFKLSASRIPCSRHDVSRGVASVVSLRVLSTTRNRLHTGLADNISRVFTNRIERPNQ